MTIPEAVQLVLQAASMGRGGEIFVLDMGEPIRIADLAREMIALSGLEPAEDIMIKYVGLRPGETLTEELITEGEGLVPTSHKKIMVLRPSSREMLERISSRIRILENLAAHCAGPREIMALVQELVPEYTPVSNRKVVTLYGGECTDAPVLETSEEEQ
jgi:FlaA1/EpsC-like NDP-sugar epimerase